MMRSIRVILWPVTRPVNRLIWRRTRRSPAFAAMYFGMQVDVSLRELGWSHRTTLSNLTHHAIALAKLGQLQEAEAELTEVIIRLTPLGDREGRLLLTARLWHEDVLRRLGWLAEIEADERFIAAAYTRTLGPSHLTTLRWREALALAQWEAGHHEEARGEMYQLYSRRMAIQGSKHPDTLRAQRFHSTMVSNEDAHFTLPPAGGAGT
jgi:hypothetical protein